MFSVYMCFHIDIIVKPAYALVQISRDFQNRNKSILLFFSLNICCGYLKRAVK